MFRNRRNRWISSQTHLSIRKKIKTTSKSEYRSHECANGYLECIFLCAKAQHAYSNWYRNYLLHIELFSFHMDLSLARISQYLFNLNVKNGWHDLYAIQLITIIECNFSHFHARLWHACMLSDGKCPKSCHQPISHHMSVLQIKIFPFVFSRFAIWFSVATIDVVFVKWNYNV